MISVHLALNMYKNCLSDDCRVLCANCVQYSSYTITMHKVDSAICHET